MQAIDLCTILGQRLRAARTACHLTQEQLATKSHVSSREISKIENGKMNPSFEILYALISAMNISSEALFSPKPSESDPLFQQLTVYYQNCPEEKRELLIKTLQFVVENLLYD
ncbi:helix-turn-helix domain-containing protein [Enterocloster sp. OA13]|uniref:helix-turn-helix domain-containing protein n=1 Tax=Enterocloster sp. OA13 TaxID=2914161 RepID=UPI00046FEE58|nr:helix-turn-helix domain-containing protein [Enterocloster sp. OA13]